MKLLPLCLALGLSLAAPLHAQQGAKASPAAPSETSKKATSESFRPALASWIGEYGGICAFSSEGNETVEIPVIVKVVAGKDSTHVEVDHAANGQVIEITLVINENASDGDRIAIGPEAMEMNPKYADPVTMSMKRITGGFGGSEALVDGEVKVYQISLNAAPKPVRTYRFRVGPE